MEDKAKTVHKDIPSATITEEEAEDREEEEETVNA